MKRPKKRWIATVSVAIVLLIAVLAIPAMLRPYLKQLVDKQADKHLTATLRYNSNKLRLSLIKNFPNVAVTIPEISVQPKAPYLHDTLFTAQSLHVVLDASTLFNDDIKIVRIEADRPTLRIVSRADGSVNYDITKTETAASTVSEVQSQTSLALKRWEVNAGTISYTDSASQLYLLLKHFNHNGSGNYKNDTFTADTESKAQLALKWGEHIFYKQLPVVLRGGLLADFTSSAYTLKEAKLIFNDFPLQINGSVQLEEEAVQTDLSFSAEGASFKQLLSIVPAFYEKEFETLKADGNLQFSGSLKGPYVYETGALPAYQVEGQVQNGRVQYPSLPEAIEAIELVIVAEAQAGTGNEGSLLKIAPFSARLGGAPVAGALQLRNADAYNLNLQGRLNLADVKRYYPLEAGTELSGQIAADMQLSGALSDTLYKRTEAAGTVTAENFSYASPATETVHIQQAEVEFDRHLIQLKQLQGQVGSSSANMSGRLSNYMAYLLEADAPLEGSLRVSASLLDLNSFMSAEQSPTADTAATSALRLPQNITLRISGTADKVLYTNLVLEQVKANLALANGIATIEQLSFNTLGGNISMSGSYNSAVPQPAFTTQLDLTDLSLARSHEALPLLQKLGPLAQHMSGNYGGSLNLAGAVDENMSPVLNLLNGKGLLAIEQAQLREVPALSKLSSAFNVPGYASTAVKNAQLRLSFTDGKMYLQPTNFMLGNEPASLQGSTSLGGELNYLLGVGIPQQLRQQLPAALQLAETATFQISGTYSSPSVKLETASAAAQVKEKLKQEAQQAKQQAEVQLKEAGRSAIDSLKSGGKLPQADSLLQETQNKLKKGVKDILKRKKN